jgi:hypothetical protein
MGSKKEKRKREKNERTQAYDVCVLHFDVSLHELSILYIINARKGQIMTVKKAFREALSPNTDGSSTPIVFLWYGRRLAV